MQKISPIHIADEKNSTSMSRCYMLKEMIEKEDNSRSNSSAENNHETSIKHTKMIKNRSKIKDNKSNVRSKRSQH